MELPEAYYLPVGDDTFESTAATTSPWDLAAQHGGPPSALLARAVDGTTDDPAFTVARLTVDMLGPIAQGVVRTEAEVVRPGRRVELVAARLFTNDVLACTATAWRVREQAESTRQLVDPPASCRRSRAGVTSYFEGVPPEWGYGPSVEWRFVEGGFRPAHGSGQAVDPTPDPAGRRRDDRSPAPVPHGRGVAHATMSDRDGVLAHVAQPLLVSRR